MTFKMSLKIMLLLVSVSNSNCLLCFMDTQGIKRSETMDENDLERFQRINCSMIQGGDIEKPCMTRTDKFGIVTRNCATLNVEEDRCLADNDANLLCYCQSDFCNNAHQVRCGAALISILLLSLQMLVLELSQSC